jgi:hypothetical protein
MTGIGNLAVISPALILVAGALWLATRAVRPSAVALRPAAHPDQSRAVLARYGVPASTRPAPALTLLPALAPAGHRTDSTRTSTAA